MTKLIICRHGNTFNPEDTPTRVGARTDIPLVESGRQQAKNIGFWLHQYKIVPDVVYSSSLKRTIETAEIAIAQTGFAQPVFPLDIFNEIDYGPDENKVEADVIARIGEDAIKAWDEDATPADGWIVDPDQITENWKNFANHAVDEEQDVVMVVTSNGIARFAPHIMSGYDDFAEKHKIKLSTGAIGIFNHTPDHGWTCESWNVRPEFSES